MRCWALGAVAVGLALLVGCDSDDPEAFAEDYAAVWCDRQEECALGDFEREFSSIDDCRAERFDHPHLPDDDRGCPVDPDAARACLDYVHDTDCAGFEGHRIEEECRFVFDC